ncbi:MAG TPA: Zn-ribbon domain-containing OB-fold protein [Phenylobacterium sp.]|nr:Zn-ribbon domain-containing OB-fold protein [Phenylobacterium sp.]
MLQPPLSHFDLQPSYLTRPFWDAAKEGRLVFQRCGACGKPFFRPEVACPHCFSQSWAWEESAGRGTLYSFSVSHRPPTPAFTAPFIFASVDLDEGWSMFSNLVGLGVDDPRIGMALQVSFHRLSEELTLPLFRPA